MSRNLALAAALFLWFAASGCSEQSEAPGHPNGIPVGNLVDFTGRTSLVGKEYGEGKVDAVEWINANGGVNGKRIDFRTEDYSYDVSRALAVYKRWKPQVVAIQGWGTGDTEALVDFVARDNIPYFSASYAAHLTDPEGRGPRTKKAAPYNFPMGPSYSDSLRALLQWAAADWRERGEGRAPRYAHMGDNHPYPDAPKAAGEAYALELGFEVLPAIGYTLTPGDFKAQCLSLRESGADYAFLGNTSGSNISLLKSCHTVGVPVQFLANIWGFDEYVMQAAGEAADGVVFVLGSARWGEEVPGMELVREIAAHSKSRPADAYRAVHYMRGICSVFFMRDAMIWADENGGLNGPNIKRAMYREQSWSPRGLEAVCGEGSWTTADHRGFSRVQVYRGFVKEAPGADIGESIARGAIGVRKVLDVEIERRAEWLGW